MSGRSCLVAACLWLACGCTDSDAGADAARGSRIELHTTSGWTLAGDYYAAGARWAEAGRPTLLLLHGYLEDRGVWQPLVPAALEAGLAVMSLDLRGHGESVYVNGERRTAAAFSPGQDFADMLEDVEAALEILVNTQSTPRARVVLVGADVGGSVALLALAKHPELPGAVLLSPGLVYKGLVSTESATNCRQPLLLLASREDKYALASMSELAARKGAGVATLRTFEGGAHGGQLLAVRAGTVTREVARFAGELLGLGGSR